MTHQVLARKWRPRTFSDVAGQQHVVRALSNALQQQRLHHAYLLTGTRGVGKTTLARLLAKGLNCDTGMTSAPCLSCPTCLAIEQGQFIDLIEIDAASRTRVEDTRELLDNVQYLPTIARYKVYLIDEVHMLSTHSFNALLKTLEEPPAHVIFILATTDPQRLPATVLSRCLQFHLKAMNHEQITQRLAHILKQENFSFTEPALTIIAQAAQGSMRDALSLLDQVLALGQGVVNEQAALDLLGGITLEAVFKLIAALAQQQGPEVLSIIESWLEEGIDFEQAMDLLISALHQINLAQIVPELSSSETIQALATQLSKEQVQLYYQIALYGKRDLAYAPTPRLGFEMSLLRMLTFMPSTAIEAPQPKEEIAKPTIKKNEPKAEIKPEAKVETVSPPAPEPAVEVAQMGPIDWGALLPQLSLSGAPKVLAEYCIIKSMDENRLELELDASHKALLTNLSQDKLAQALSNYFQRSIYVKIAVGANGLPCPANLAREKATAVLNQAEQCLLQDKNLQGLLKQFNGSIEPGSIKAHSTEEKDS